MGLPDNRNDEDWFPVPGWDGVYSISRSGRIRSEERAVMRRDGTRQTVRRKELRPTRNSNGYPCVELCLPGVRSVRMIHVLLLETFVGPRPPGLQGCHNDDDPENYSLENLRWDTRSENSLDRGRNGIDHNSNKTHCPQGHPYDDLNTLVYTRPSGKTDRRCRSCRREHAIKRKHSRAQTRAA
ncbi:NUMOD4 domain-containing protein [Nocardia halotolerans]|uniref:NUMOD4 domain-containing protein n=1 Tax=Nocardia halotolerans TaxID=1755878 RepID=A0ABV8VBU9_9NOCA